MSVSTEVQRTLVKSPPELWSELSNPEALARHLSELGEIRITAVEPETKVEWKSEQASGFVHLKQSSWGTKVTLSATRTAPALEEPSSESEAIAQPTDAQDEPEDIARPTDAQEGPDPAREEPELESEPELASEHEPVSVEPQPVAPEPESVAVEPESVAVEPESVAVGAESVAVEPETEPVVGEPVAVVELDPEPSPGKLEPQLGFFARLFRKRRSKLAAVVSPEPGQSVTVESDVEPEPESKPEIEIVALAAPEPVYPDPPAQPEASEPAADLATELESLEDQMAAETAELLTGVLDRLGAAHHRPFSRG